MRQHPGPSFSVRKTYPLTMVRLLLLCVLVLVPAYAVSGQSSSAGEFDDVAGRARQAWVSRRLADAARLYGEAVKLKPDWAEGWGYLAASLYEQKRYAEARDAYRRTTVLTPENGPSWSFAGLCEYELRDYGHAFDDLSTGERLGLSSDLGLQSSVKYRMALLWNTSGHFELGLKEIAWFADHNDRNPDAMVAIGLSMLRMPLFPYEIPGGKREMVVKAGQAGWEMNAHHLEDSRRLFGELAAAYPDEPNVHYAYGYVLAFLDQEAAVKEFQKELAVTPTHVPAMVQAAFLCLKMGRLDESAALARRAMKLDSRDYAPHNILGRVLVEKHQFKQGIEELETAGKLAPRHPGNHFNLAQAYEHVGRKADATREFAAFEKLNRQAGPSNEPAGGAAIQDSGDSAVR
jgi:tetratricopeptide (TPR) repeat protein